MKKTTTALLALTVLSGALIASPVPVKTAQQVAASYYSQNSLSPATDVTLAYTETDNSGNTLYYVFNINGSDGFVIVSADDALHPIIGYSNEGRAYVLPEKGTNMDYRMQKRKTEISTNVVRKLKATPVIADEWTSYINNTEPKYLKETKQVMGSKPFPSSTNYLMKSTYDQSNPYSSGAPYFYNSLCPGHSVTGCVATAMAQIMRYWQYPAHGTGSSSYCDCTSKGDAVQYGTLTANYATTNYHYNNMPLNPTSITDVDTLTYDAGISVAMNYSPSESSSYVLTSDAGGNPCAQTSYVNYFGYSSTILDGLNESNFSDTVAWQDTLETELNHSRCIQYAGQTTSKGGHTWICDGFNATNFFHMNWGWGGDDDGWYSINNLNAGGYDFNSGFEALVGIMPPGGLQPPANPTCDTVNNIPKGATTTYYYISTHPKTYYAGTYGDTVQQIAEYFNAAPPTGYAISQVNIDFARASSTNASRTVTINIWDNTGKGGSPGAILATQSLLVSDIQPFLPMLINFPNQVAVTTPYYVGVDYTTMASNFSTDTLAMVSDEIGKSKATAWQYDVAAKYSLNGWYADSVVWSGIKFSQDISVTMCSTTIPLEAYSYDLNEGVKLYPNPTSGIVNAAVSLDEATDVQVEVYNSLGQLVQQAHWNDVSDAIHTINLSAQANGMYFIKLTTDKTTITKKVMISR